jgi:hypothetical protein
MFETRRRFVMKHRFAVTLAAAAVACITLVAGAAGGGKGQLFIFAGQLVSTPGANATSLSLQVETGNKPALRSMIGATQNEVFAVNSGTEVLGHSRGIPHVTSTAELQAGDYVTIRIRAPRGSSLQTIEGTAAALVSDSQGAPRGNYPLWLFSGTVAGGQSGGQIALTVNGGNWKALHAMLGQPLAQSFAYDNGTIFLLWQGRVPTVIDQTQLKAGEEITVRIRAPRSDSLAQVESTPANHVGDHEPAPAPEE